MNPRAAINDLLLFQGSPFGLLGTSPYKNQNAVVAVSDATSPRAQAFFFLNYTFLYSDGSAHFKWRLLKYIINLRLNRRLLC